jgi:hypothetical protein
MFPSPFQARVLEAYPLPRTFSVISWGCAGTSWLAVALNSHLDIYCVHAMNYFWRHFGGAPNTDGLDYIRIVGLQGHAHKLAGEVHGLSRHHIPEVQQALGDQFRAAVVVREPLPRLRSQLALMEYFADLPGAWDVDQLNGLSAVLGYDVAKLPYQTKLRIHAANMLNAIVEEVNVGPVFRIEDVGSNAQSLAHLVDFISGGEIIATSGWLDLALRLPRVNSHAARLTSQITEQDLDFVRKIVRPEAWALYRDLGYPMPRL